MDIKKFTLATFISISLIGCLAESEDSTVSVDDTAALELAHEADVIPLTGTSQFAQTHLINENETRFAPKLSEQKDTLFIFMPDGVNNYTSGTVEVFDGGQSQGVIALTQIGDESNILEQPFAKEDLGTVSKGGWQASIPWYAITPATSFSVTLTTDEGAYGSETNIIPPIQAPDFSYFMALNTISAFSNEEYTSFNYSINDIAPTYAQDYYSTLPFSKVIKSDYSQAVWPEIVINSDSKAARFASVDALEADPLANNDTYTIIKNHLAQRLMSANSGEGLKSDTYDLSSRFIFGNYATFGVRRKLDGTYSNIHRGGAAGGWVGWSALWNHASSTYAHEVGHNFRMSHWFNTGDRSAEVSAEYTRGQEFLDTLPTPYDSTRQLFKTTRLINSDGSIATHNDGSTRGYSDYMSYDGHSNRVVSFNHYTPYSTKQIQDTILTRPSLQGVKGQWSAYEWDDVSKLYVENFAKYSAGIQEPIKSGVEVATIIGTISNEIAGQYLYPLIFNRYGNIYEYHDTLEETEYDPALYPFYIKINYINGLSQYESINIKPVDGSRPFGLNVAFEDQVDSVALYNVDTLVQQLEIPAELPEHTPITFFMGKGVNTTTGNVIFTAECFGTLCNVNEVDAWVYRIKDGYLDVDVDNALVTHFDGYSVIRLDNGVEIKAYRYKTITPEATRSLATQPLDWSLSDEENIKFEFISGDSVVGPSSQAMVKVKDHLGDRKTESFVMYTSDLNEISTNVALGKPASQSTTYGSGKAPYLVDSDISTLNHTKCSFNQWAEVDLEFEFNLSKLKLTHRDSWMSRLNDSRVVALDGNRNEVWGTTVSNAYVWEYETGLMNDGFTGQNIRYIRIENDNCIHWAEIEAYIDPIYN